MKGKKSKNITVDGNQTTGMVSAAEKKILRDLASQVAEIAADPIQKKTADLWRRLNRLERTRPLIMLWDDTHHETGHRFKFKCQSEFARSQEKMLMVSIDEWENLKHDRVWAGTIACPIAIRGTGYGINVDKTRPDHVFGASRYNTVITDGESPRRIPMPIVTVDWEDTERRYQAMLDIYGEILKVEKVGVSGYWYESMDTFITWRGIEQTFMDMVDRPQWVHAWMERMCHFQLSLLDQYEKLNILSLNNNGQNIGSGGVGITDELPKPGFDPSHVRTIDQWGHATTQIFSEVSPAMHEEFALQYEKRFLSRFGLASYGCCEPLDQKIGLILKHIPNVRRISMSPWVNVERGAEALGKKAIFSYKPNPAMLGMETWNIDSARQQLRDVFEKTRDCIVEVIMKDLHTVRGEVKRMGDWVAMAKELAEEYA